MTVPESSVLLEWINLLVFYTQLTLCGTLFSPVSFLLEREKCDRHFKASDLCGH